MTQPALRERATQSGASQRRLPAILSIGTAAPHGQVSQQDAAAIAEGFSCDTDGQRAWLRRVFLRSGVEHRGSVLHKGNPVADANAFYGSRHDPAGPGPHGPSTATRMERYAAEAPAIAERAARAALATIDAQSITHLITVSCTGFFAPGLDVALISRLSLRPDVQRQHLGFMGCHAAFNALAAARDAVLAAEAQGREARVLICCVELCTLHFAYGWQPEKLVANALFADGAAACVVGTPDPHATAAADTPWRLLHTTSMLLPDSLNAMTWKIGNNGFEMTLSSELPALIGTHIRPWCEQWLARQDMTLHDVAHWAIHPGGPRIVDAAVAALGLQETDVQHSRRILADHGNLSSATLLFLLQQPASADARGTCVAIGFGPGLMAEGLLLER